MANTEDSDPSAPGSIPGTPAKVIDLGEFRKKVEQIPLDDDEGSLFDEDDPFTEEQFNRILLAVFKAEDKYGEPSDEEVYAVMDWAYDCMFRVAALNQVLEGNASLRWDSETEQILIDKIE